MVYVHVPFCLGKCIYCAFYSMTPGKGMQRSSALCKEDLFEAYTERVCQEMEDRKDEILSSVGEDGQYNTLYIGGGTPSVLPSSFFKEVSSTLLSIIPTPPSEFTVEVNPEDIALRGEKYVTELLGCGVNRISMGVQSLDDDILKWMHRRHDSATVLRAVSILRSCGIGNLSLDLIFGVPGMGMEKWEDTLERTLDLHPEHLSAYQLSFDEGSALGKLLALGKVSQESDEVCCEQYGHLCRKMRERGYLHYEVSNFCLEGMHSRHNSAYWERVPYVGVGSMAHSFYRTSDGKEVRYSNSGALMDREISSETLTQEDARLEELMLSLRTSKGLPGKRLYELCDKDKVDGLLSEGSLSVQGNNLRIPEKKFFVSDSIICELA